ncbi:hypothetical protein EC845_1759 [Comamonas sp. BIGb0124]|uniref:DUF6436 domain-containing protein n=1 Tax=Comamonas sp. BIGb0124 TaxID=2485130 RepID=UPI000F944AB5|nr:DUF6436 domain-containing protein [Comamonas sp. BIGb0124]ROR22851.1 hypothetical protein EC845_1759 [Comamonas sp. BIGb0124]
MRINDPTARAPRALHHDAGQALVFDDVSQRLPAERAVNTGLVCSSANSFLVEPLIDRLMEGQTVEPIGMLAVGCYCRWKD